MGVLIPLLFLLTKIIPTKTGVPHLSKFYYPADPEICDSPSAGDKKHENVDVIYKLLIKNNYQKNKRHMKSEED